MYGKFFRRKPRNGDPYYLLITCNEGEFIIKLLKGIYGAEDLVCERSEIVADPADANFITTEIMHELMSDGWIPTTDFSAGIH